MPPSAPDSPPPGLELAELQEAWRRSILPTVEGQGGGIPAAAMLAEAHPAALEDDVLTLEFPEEAQFHRKHAEEPKNVALLEDALYEVTGRRLQIAFATGTRPDPRADEPDRPATEEEIVELVKSTFDAQELDV